MPEATDAGALTGLLTGKTVWVTGAGGTIGAGIVRACENAGARVIGTGLSPNDPSIEVCDVRDSASIDGFVDSVWDRYGSLDVLVNNAAVTVRKDILEVTEAEWENIFAVNVKGTFLCSQAVARRLVDAGRPGSIVNISSINASVAHAATVAYAATKGAIQTMSYGLAVALGPHGIRVNVVAPGTVESNLNAERWTVPGNREKATERTPLGRLGLAEDIAPTVVFLASDMSSYTTGAVVHVDGGKLRLA
ncbi:SDR family NAD(P)-dependent oxidoreductase [Compostimonas suwonensis]|uniref:NAD(P)-dependent dehydrogenase (Short-subunit alcohol dehydrogenase family) n=1 Tax=Compostimonas suwonensis TaxID=1048394 RepID=A0A2M9BCI7_9MICO|nr:SDR family oxidoreductase [Compostimonas suwonensis]PJJ55614.1 NAD(P)-dependent dehydrogenase (short-subunit alcohol dehydrogenase family) [Compostimonas suwonensis]